MSSKKTTLRVGTPTVLEAPSLFGKFGAVFEDDGETAYFYALDFSSGDESPIQEALHIYNVRSVTDRQKPSELVINWSEDGAQVALLINSYPHAVFDFTAKRGFCRSNFPKPTRWSCPDFKWDDNAMKPFSVL